MESIHLPKDLPYLLKDWTKAAFKTQPVDLLDWSHFYWEAIKLKKQVPVKKSFESKSSQGEMTIGNILVVKRIVNIYPQFNFSILKRAWAAVGMTESQLKKVTTILDDFGLEINEINFFAAAVKVLKPDTIDAMNVICELNTKIEGPRTSYIMKTSTFEKYYNVIADLNNETAEKRQRMTEIIEKNENEISPHSFNSKLSLISILVSEDLIKPL